MEAPRCRRPNSTLEAVLGQRLLRSICPGCRTTYQPDEALLAELGMMTLRQDGLRSIFAGDTTIEEVLKYR